MERRTQFTLGTLFFVIGVAAIDCLVLKVVVGDVSGPEDDVGTFFGLATAIAFFCSLFAYLGYVAHFIIRVLAERRRVRCYAINVPSEATMRSAQREMPANLGSEGCTPHVVAGAD